MKGGILYKGCSYWCQRYQG